MDKYNAKRNFDKTKEPKGESKEVKPQKQNKRLRFVVQHHIARREHYDFRLEWDEVLLSWAVPKGPSYNPQDKRLAVHVEDHPIEYRNFEGAIPKGEYGGGTVMLWDEGFWQPQPNFYENLQKHSLKFTLYGKRLKGNWTLIRLKPKENEPPVNWLLIKENDEFALSSNGIEHYVTSIRTGRDMEQISTQS